LLITSSSATETFDLGERLAPLLTKGSIVAIKGPIGAGKTCLAKGIAKGLGIAEEITSPTYTIVSEYEAVLSGEEIRLFHIDAYRLRGNDDFSAIGGEEIVFGNSISVIEWSERISDFITEEALNVDIEMMENNQRLIRVYREPKVRGNSK
jgi:tRNA threonylcarbamoyladenosine biosynthesis protein TsaE